MNEVERYTPGHSEVALDFMRVRSGPSHAAYLLPHLSPDDRVLDCGCGPGTITVDLAAAVAPGEVIGIDQQAEQLEHARALASERGLSNATFREADVYALPFADASFDAVFSNALLEHVADPLRALGQMHRVLRPGGVIGVSVPDWSGGTVLGPPGSGIEAAVERYREVQRRNGGGMDRGRVMSGMLREVGFSDPQVSARAEVFRPDLAGGLLAEMLEEEFPEVARATRAWIEHPDALFAQIWIEAVATA